jgi:hypothetical protein
MFKVILMLQKGTLDLFGLIGWYCNVRMIRLFTIGYDFDQTERYI